MIFSAEAAASDAASPLDPVDADEAESDEDPVYPTDFKTSSTAPSIIFWVPSDTPLLWCWARTSLSIEIPDEVLNKAAITNTLENFIFNYY